MTPYLGCQSRQTAISPPQGGHRNGSRPVLCAYRGREVSRAMILTAPLTTPATLASAAWITALTLATHVQGGTVCGSAFCPVASPCYQAWSIPTASQTIRW